MILARVISGLLGVIYLLNAGHMILAPEHWYLTTPGVPANGPFNAHFVIDIGLIYLACAAAFAVWAWRPAVGAVVPAMAAAWPLLHGLFHLAHWTEGLPEGLALWTELIGVVGLAGLGAAVAWRAASIEGRA